jgi:hypothetical protein
MEATNDAYPGNVGTKLQAWTSDRPYYSIKVHWGFAYVERRRPLVE